MITGQYPRALFDFLVGINRWLYRVLTYLALMHDEYSPFRLDHGQYETDVVEPDQPVTTPALVHTPACGGSRCPLAGMIMRFATCGLLDRAG